LFAKLNKLLQAISAPFLGRRKIFSEGHFRLIHQAGRHEYVPVGSVDSSMNRKPLDEPSKIAPQTPVYILKF